MKTLRSTAFASVLLLALPCTLAAPPSIHDLVVRYRATLVGDPDYKAQRKVLESLADLKTPAARAKLQELLESHGRGDRRRTVELLGACVRHGQPRDVDAAVRWVERSRDPLLVELLPMVFGRIQDPASREYLRGKLLLKSVPTTKAQIARALGMSNDAACVLPLMGLLQVPTLRVRVEALLALGQLQDARARVPIELFLRNEDERVRATAARALGLMRSRASVNSLVRALEDVNAQVVESAAEALGHIGAPLAVSALIRGLESTHQENLRLADAFTDALHGITGKGIGPDPKLWHAWWESAKDQPLVKANEKAASAIADDTENGFAVRSSKVIFLLDVSRRMGWNRRLDAAKEKLVRTLETLPRNTRFNVIVYSDHVIAWRKKLAQAKSGAVASAIGFVRRQKADSNDNTHAALQAAFGDPEADTVFLLSDGRPTVGAVVDPELIRIAVQDWNRFRRVRVHCVAFLRGDPPPAFAGSENRKRAMQFLKRLAAENHGWFLAVP